MHVPRCIAATSRNLQMCIGVEKWTGSQFWQAATQNDDWNGRKFCTNKSGKTRSETSGMWQERKRNFVKKKKKQSKMLATIGTHLMLPQRVERHLLILRHYQDVLSRFPQHAVNIEWGRGEAIFVPVSAFIKTQPGGKNNGRISERRATNRLELSERSQSRGADVRMPSPNMPNWQRRVSDGHQRSSLVQEEDAVLLLKDLQTGTSVCFHNWWHHAKTYIMRVQIRGR